MQRSSRPTWQLACLLAAALLMGCKESQQASTSPSAVVDPSASFTRVVENLRHNLDQQKPPPITEIENGAYTDIRRSDEVTGQKLQPPTDESDEYRGQITVTTKWTTYVRPAAETEEDQPKEKKEEDAQQSNSEVPEVGGASGDVEILDPSVVADLLQSAPRDPSALAPNLGRGDAGEEALTFHFVFRDNRWKLVPQPLKPIEPGVEASGLADVNTNESIERAVEHALKRQ